MVKCNLESFDAFVSNCYVTQKLLAVEQKSEIWDSGAIVNHIWDTFDLVFNVIFGPFGAFMWKCPVTRNWLAVEEKRVKCGSLSCNIYMGRFDLLVFNVILRLFSALVSNWYVIRKRLALEQNGVKFGSRVTCNLYVGYIWPFKVMWGSFGALVSKWHVTRKQLAAEHRCEIWELVAVVICIWSTLDLLVFKVISGHSVHLSQMAYNSKTDRGP